MLRQQAQSLDRSRSARDDTLQTAPRPPNQSTTIAAHADSNSSDIHRSAIPLQHRPGNVSPSSYPSNREGFEGQSRGLRTVLFDFGAFVGSNILSGGFSVSFNP